MLQNWAERMQIPYTCLSTAKNIMNESHPLYAGVYAGAASAASTCQLVEQSDCLIAIGPRFTDVATAFSHIVYPHKICCIWQIPVFVWMGR